jgi:signal peptidase I
MDEIEKQQPEQDNTETPEEDKKKKDPVKEIYDWLQCIISAILICVLAFMFVFRMIGVYGESMEQTLHEGDRVIISNLFYTPEQGDIVVLRKDTFRDEAIIKRVIATEGQTVDIDFDAGIVYVDGEALDEPYINEPTYTQESFVGPITIPEGCVFVMGDNRNASTDSRDSRIGIVDNRYILGRVLIRVYPTNVFGKVD